MSSAAVRIGVGTRLVHDGELVEIVEIHAGRTGMDAVRQHAFEGERLRHLGRPPGGASRALPHVVSMEEG